MTSALKFVSYSVTAVVAKSPRDLYCVVPFLTPSSRQCGMWRRPLCVFTGSLRSCVGTVRREASLSRSLYQVVLLLSDGSFVSFSFSISPSEVFDAHV